MLAPVDHLDTAKAEAPDVPHASSTALDERRGSGRIHARLAVKLIGFGRTDSLSMAAGESEKNVRSCFLPAHPKYARLTVWLSMVWSCMVRCLDVVGVTAGGAGLRAAADRRRDAWSCCARPSCPEQRSFLCSHQLIILILRRRKQLLTFFSLSPDPAARKLRWRRAKVKKM